MKPAIRTLLKVVLWLFGGKPHLTVQQKKQVLLQWKEVQQNLEPTVQILEAEKVFTSALRLLGYKGTFAEQWKKAEAQFGKRPKVWKAHRLRNKIVHEPDASASKADAQFVVESYQPVITTICR